MIDDTPTIIQDIHNPTPIERIYDFNHQAGLLSNPYNDFLEASFQIEEALEGFDLAALTHVLSASDHTEPPSAKYLARYITSSAGANNIKLSDVDRLDKACDAVVFAVGSMAKLGLTPAQIEQALHIVMDSNQAKLGCLKDEHGKLMKPANFPNPEPRLQALLDLRN